MNNCLIISNDSFQEAWQAAIRVLSKNKWEMWNLIVQINNPRLFNEQLNYKITQFSKSKRLIPPKDVAYTIFPFGLYNLIIKKGQSRRTLYEKYERKLYKWTIRRAKNKWGTYFHRMINYNGYNQLEKIITKINSRKQKVRTPYLIYICKIESERPYGGPCLTYLGVQIETHQSEKIINLLCVYRNHDFVERAYGNYFGLCKLLVFLCSETNSHMGRITCISSHAYVDKHRRALLSLINNE